MKVARSGMKSTYIWKSRKKNRNTDVERTVQLLQKSIFTTITWWSHWLCLFFFSLSWLNFELIAGYCEMLSRGHWCLTFSSQSSWGKNWQTQPYISLPHVIAYKCVNFASTQDWVLKSAIENPYYIDVLKHKHDVSARAELDKNMFSNRVYFI